MIPNLEETKKLSNKIEDEYNISEKISRYQSVPDLEELFETATNYGLTDKDDAARALFVADYIISASELPSGSTDLERYNSIFKAFQLGVARNKSTERLMRIFYLAYQVAINIRRHDLFMSGRGVTRKTGLLRLKDAHITPYLEVANDILGKKGSCSWELGILSATLKKVYPHKELGNFSEKINYKDYDKLTPIIWRLLEDYSDHKAIEINPNLTVPNLTHSKSVIFTDQAYPNLFSLWNFSGEPKLLEREINAASKILDDISVDEDFVYARARIQNTLEHFYFIRDPRPPNSIFIIKTTTDDINLTRLLTILSLRGKEKNGWKFLSKKQKTVVKKKEKKKVKKTSKKKVKREVIKDRKVSTGSSESQGFFGKIKGLFGKSKKVEEETKTIQEKVIIEEEQPFTEYVDQEVEVEEEKIEELFLPHFFAQATTIEGVGDLPLFEEFDNIRDDNYTIIGAFDSNKETQKTSFILDDLSGINASKMVQKLNTLDQLAKRIMKSLFKEENQFFFDEIFFKSESGKKLITINGNQSMFIGVIGASYIDPIAHWKSRSREKLIVQRRSITMRANQFLSARRHTRFDTAMERIFEGSFDFSEAKTEDLDQEIFP